MSPAAPSKSNLKSRDGTSGVRLAMIFEPASGNTGTLAPADGKKKAKKSEKHAEPLSHGYNILKYLKPPPGGPFHQENSPPNSPSKKSNTEAAGSGKQHEASAIHGKNIHFIDMGDEEEFIDMTGWQCPYQDCHDMNSSMTNTCKRCDRQNSRANLKLFEAFEREDR